MRNSAVVLTNGLVLVVFGGLVTSSPPSDVDALSANDLTAKAVARNYRDLRLVTPEPVFVNPELAILCGEIPAEAVEAARKQHGVHAHSLVSIYMNELAADVFDGGKGAYPVGSVIVKEKWFHPYEGDDRGPENRDGVGGMIKRPDGYDSEHGNWEYFYFEQPDQIESGRIASCIDCHEGARNRDFVFASWADPDE